MKTNLVLFVVAILSGVSTMAADLSGMSAESSSNNMADIYISANDQTKCEQDLAAARAVVSQNKVVLSVQSCVGGGQRWVGSVRVLK